MKKIGIAVVLAGLFVVGCGDSGLVKLENKNPTIDQKKYDLYVQALNESNYAKEYELSHIDILLNEYEPIMAKCKLVGEFFCNKISNKNTLIKSKDNIMNEMQRNNTLIILAINKKNKDDLRFITLSCKKQECNTIDDVQIKGESFFGETKYD
ncbi:hypothetical protein [Helicobacter sp. UBA3407]|uniref:hypothetical protein n=1 Tax=Helicobacter sp. UBA3407 TaxID=1946588 RepID=UPI0026143C0D|nr:hypothetical protein [Helicobacter sp. UBA3407]